MGLPKDTLDTIQSTAVKANGSVFFTPPNGCEPHGTYYRREADGTLTKVRGDRQPYNQAVGDFESLALRLHQGVDEAAGDGAKSVWYHIAGVTIKLDHDLRDTIKLPLTLSEQIVKLQEWASEKYEGAFISHKEICVLFRTLFRGCLDKHEGLSKNLQRIDFKAMADSVSEQKRDGTSVSKSMMRQVSNMELLPEVLTFKVPFFDEPVCKVEVTVDVAFDPMAEEEQFRLIVLPQELEQATAKALEFLYRKTTEAIKNQYGTDDAGNIPPIYYGSPAA